MSKFTPDVREFDGIRQALHQEIEAHAQTKAALTAAEAKLEAVGELAGKWRGYPDLAFSIVDRFARDLQTALDSTGPSLRERVAKAVADVRECEQGAGDTDYTLGLSHAADLVQAALEGE